MSIIKACLVGNSLKNTGKECDAAMGPTAMLIAVPRTTVITEDDLADPIAWITPLLHASKQQRVYPFFGNQAPINTITNSAEGDITVTLDDGTIVFLRYGVYNRTYETIAGGLCYAKALQGLNKSGYSIIEIDQTGQMLLHKNGKNTDGDFTWGGLLTSFMYSPSPIMPDFKTTPYKNRFQMSYTPIELVQFGEVFTGAGSLLDLMGLIDVEILEGTENASSATHLFIKVQTECAESDIIALLGAPLADLTNFIITNKATGAVVTPSAIAITDGEIDFTGVFASGETFVVTGAAPSVWLGNHIEGYDAEDSSVDILIP